jgi:hypothetical protein
MRPNKSAIVFPFTTNSILRRRSSEWLPIIWPTSCLTLLMNFIFFKNEFSSYFFQNQWSVCQLANALATVTANSDCDVTSSPLGDWTDGGNKSSAGTSRQAIQAIFPLFSFIFLKKEERPVLPLALRTRSFIAGCGSLPFQTIPS